MKLEMTTDFLRLIEPGTYGTLLGDFLYEIRDEHTNDWLNAMVEHGIDKINEILSEDSIVEKFGVCKAENGKMRSPQFYNYTNDSIEFDLIVTDEMIETIRNTKYTDDFFKWTEENYGSCSGFISFFPYTKEKFEEAIYKDDLDLSMAVAMLIMKEIKDNISESEMERWQRDYEDDVIEELCNNDWQIREELE